MFTKLVNQLLPRSLRKQTYLADRVSVRIPVYTVEGISLNLTDPVANNFKISNISSGGMAISLPSDLGHQFNIGDRISGVLQFEKKRYPFSATVRYCLPTLMGVQYLNPSTDLISEFHKYFQSEIEGHLMKRVERPVQVENGDELVLYESESSELKLTLHDGALKHFQIYFLGHFVDGGVGRPTRYGVLLKGGKDSMKDASLTDSPPREVISMVRKFIFSIENLPGQWAEGIDFCIWVR